MSVLPRRALTWGRSRLTPAIPGRTLVTPNLEPQRSRGLPSVELRAVAALTWSTFPIRPISRLTYITQTGDDRFLRHLPSRATVAQNQHLVLLMIAVLVKGSFIVVFSICFRSLRYQFVNNACYEFSRHFILIDLMQRFIEHNKVMLMQIVRACSPTSFIHPLTRNAS